MPLTSDAHQIIMRHFANKDKRLAVDATCGNGHDTVFLMRLGFNKVIGFDIQKQAIKNTQERLNAAGLGPAVLLNQGHEKMTQYITESVDCIMFNFGYLPKASKHITTTKGTSLKALNLALKIISEQGLISLICYPGHPQGAEETLAIKHWLTTLSDGWSVEKQCSMVTNETSPILYTLKRT